MHRFTLYLVADGGAAMVSVVSVISGRNIMRLMEGRPGAWHEVIEFSERVLAASKAIEDGETCVIPWGIV